MNNTKKISFQEVEICPNCSSRDIDHFDLKPSRFYCFNCKSYLLDIKIVKESFDCYEYFKRCAECGAIEGEWHYFGCVNEECPFCKNDLIGCDCIYQKLKNFCQPFENRQYHFYYDNLEGNDLRKLETIFKKYDRIHYLLFP
ncbi:hypothetical protein LCGC14_2877280, partial [marine sediment metagenome]